MDITNTEGHNDGQNSAARANLGQPLSSSPETPQHQIRNVNPRNHRNNQSSFRDILDDEPVLPMSNLRTRDESDEDSQGNASTAATFAGYGRDDREEGTGNHSSDSSGSSTRDARLGRPPIQGFIRPRGIRWSDRPTKRHKPHLPGMQKRVEMLVPNKRRITKYQRARAKEPTPGQV